MPSKDIFSNIQPRGTQSDVEYREYVKSEIKKNNPEVRDFFLNDFADEFISTQPKTAPKAVDNSLSELAKKYTKPKSTEVPKGTNEAFKDFVSPVAKPALKDPLQEVAKVAQAEQEGVDAQIAEKKLQASDPMYANAPKIVAPKINPTHEVIDEGKAMGDITNYLVNKSEQEKDVFAKTADLHVSKGTPAQKQAYAQALRENQQLKAGYQAQLDANVLPDEEFKKNIRLADIEKENRGALVASKYGGDAENINSHIREYMDSPQWKVDALKYAKNPADLDRASRVALDVYADKLAGTPTKVQGKVTNFMNSKIGQAISPLAQTAEGLAKAPLETGGFLGAVLSKAVGLTDKSLAEKISENQSKVDKTVPSFRSETAPEWQQFVGEIGNSFGAIEGGVLGTNNVIPKLFEKGRKVAAYGNASELTKLASEAGKTTKSSYLSELSNALKSTPAIKSAEILDNTLANIAMMGGAQVASEREKYKSWGFSDEEADKKAMTSSLINSVGLALPNVIRPSAVSELKRLKGESGAINSFLDKHNLDILPAFNLKAMSRQGMRFTTDMASLRAVQGGIDGQSLEQTFEGGARAAAKDFILGAMMSAASGSHGRRAVSSTQREAIGNALKDRSTLNSELKGNEQEFATTNSFLNTIEPLYKAAKERGLNENLAVADAIERASMIQAERKLSEVEAAIESKTGTYTTINEETGQPEQKVRYMHENGQWHEQPDPALIERHKQLKNDYGFARQASDNIQKGIYDGDRVISSSQMAEIAAKKSPEGKLRAEQELPIEVNSPYNSDVIDLTQYAEAPEVQAAIESFGNSELVKDAYTDVTPVIAEDGTILDGAKGIAAALSRGETEMYAYKSLPKSEVNEIANEAANDGLQNEVSEEGLDKVGKTALKEMTEVYADVLKNNFTEDGLPDFAKAMQTVVEDGLNRGYEKKEILDMANRINANIPEPILERYYNDAIKIPNERTEPANIGETERVIDSVQPIEETPKGQSSEANIQATVEDAGRVGAEGTAPVSVSENVNIEQLGNYFIVSDKNGDPIDGTTFYSSKEAAEKVAQKLNDGQAKTNTEGQSQKSDITNSKIAKKVTGQAKKRADPTIKNETYLRALEVESTDPTTKALQYFIGGGRISSESIKELYKKSKGEHNSKIGIIAKDAPSIEDLAHKLWEEGGERDLTTSDYKNAIEDVLNTYSSKTVMAESVAEQHIDSQIEKYYTNLEAELKAEEKEYEEYISDATDIFAEMTEAEVDKLLADENMSDEIVAKSLEPKTDSKSVLFELNSQLDQKQSELRKEENKLSKLQQGLQSAGKENQFDIFGSKPSDATLFETDLSEARKLVDAQKKIVEQKRGDLSEIKTKIDEVPSDNQIALELSEPERVKLSDKLDKLADKLRGMEGEGNVYSTPIPPHIASDAVRLLAKLVRGGENMAEAIKKVIAYVNSKMDKPLKESEVKSFVENILGGEVPKEIFDQIKPEYKEGDQFKVEATGEEVEKTIVSRLDKTKLDEKTNDALEASGLTRKRQNFDEVETAAKQFVDKVGYEKAIKAIEEGKVFEGAELTATFNEIDKRIIDEILSMEEGEEKDALRTLRGELLNKFGEKATASGQLNAYSARVQADPSTPFDSQKEIQSYKESNGGGISKEKEQEIIKQGEEIDRLNKRLRELEAEKTAQLAKQNLLDIKADIQKKKFTSNKDSAKKIADQVRKLKSKPIKFTDADGNEITVMSNAAPFFNELIELAAKSIEKTGEIADGIKAIRERLKQEGWFNKLSDRDKNAVYTQVESFLEKEITPDPSEGLTNQYIRDVVAKGVENFDDFMAKVQKDFPKMTKVEITDSISKYGKVINATRTELEKDVQKYKSMSLLASKLQRALNGERPVKTGFQRDAPDADIRSMMKELREAMKELPETPEMESDALKSSLDAIKTRLQNQIEDYQKQIESGEKIEKSKRATTYDKDALVLKEKRDALKEQFDEVFGKDELSDEQRLERAVKGVENATEKLKERIKENKLEIDKKDDAYKYTERYRKAKAELEKEREFLKQLQEEAAIPEKKWIEKTKEALQKQIAEDQRRIDQKDFAKVERKKFDDTSELIELRAKRLRIREELEKEKEKNRLENRTKWEKRKDALLSLWDIPRATRATGEASFVGVQGLIPTIKYGLTNPKRLGEAIKKSFIHAFNEKKTQEWIDKMKTQDFYPLMKESKLALTEPNAKATAAEETAFSNWTDTIWGVFDKSQKRNPFKAFERSAVTFLDSMRMNMFLDGVQTLESEGYNPKENEKAYKDLAKYVNTFTGRGTLISGIEGTKFAEALTKVLFSPRLWAAKIQRLNPVYYKNLDPKVRAMAVKDLTRFIGLSTSLTLLAAAQLNNDDDDKTSVELDPRSSDFMKLKFGNTRVDFFGGNLTELVYISRMLPYVGGYKSTKKPDVKELGADRFTPTRWDLTLTQATNKLNPAAAMAQRFFNKEKDGKGEWRDAYGKPYSFKQDVMESLTPIYWGNTVPELIQDKDADFTLPALIGLGAFGFFGGGVNTYDPPKSKVVDDKAVIAK